MTRGYARYKQALDQIDHASRRTTDRRTRLLSHDEPRACSNALPMPRKLRLEFPGAIYHVMSRGDQREDLFLCDVTFLRSDPDADSRSAPCITNALQPPPAAC